MCTRFWHSLPLTIHVMLFWLLIKVPPPCWSFRSCDSNTPPPHTPPPAPATIYSHSFLPFSILLLLGFVFMFCGLFAGNALPPLLLALYKCNRNSFQQNKGIVYPALWGYVCCSVADQTPSFHTPPREQERSRIINRFLASYYMTCATVVRCCLSECNIINNLEIPFIERGVNVCLVSFSVAKEGMVNDCANEVPGLVTFYAGCGWGRVDEDEDIKRASILELVTCIGS